MELWLLNSRKHLAKGRKGKLLIMTISPIATTFSYTVFFRCIKKRLFIKPRLSSTMTHVVCVVKLCTGAEGRWVTTLTSRQVLTFRVVGTCTIDPLIYYPQWIIYRIICLFHLVLFFSYSILVVWDNEGCDMFRSVLIAGDQNSTPDRIKS